MGHKTLIDMLSDANDIVKRLSFDDVNKLIESGNTLIIDVREESEVACRKNQKLNSYPKRIN